MPSRSDLGGSPELVRVRTRTERHSFRCGACGATWVATYDVRDYLGSSGARWVVHCRDGEPARSPSFGDRCPGCGSVCLNGHVDGAAAGADRWIAAG